MRYQAIHPRYATVSAEYLSRWEVSVPSSVSFWDFLNLHWKKQLIQVVFWLACKLQIVTLSKAKVEYVSYKTTEINIKDIVSETYKHVEEVANRTGKLPKVLFVGRDIDNAIALEMSDRLVVPIVGSLHNGTHGCRMFAGMKIVLVPWMEGFFAWHPDYER